ncbi:MAG: hypothetical protein WD035_01655 [Balneolaceae bacterium]
MLSFVSIHGQLMAQKTTQAVMQVSAEVIAGSHMEESITYDFSDQLNNPDQENQTLRFGEFSMTIPDGTTITARFEGNIRMNNESDEFFIEAGMEETDAGDGQIIYNLFGSTNGSKIASGKYEGEQRATIEYH